MLPTGCGSVWVDGDHTGLDERVNQTRLICPWTEVEQLLEQERLHLALAGGTRGVATLLVSLAVARCVSSPGSFVNLSKRVCPTVVSLH